MDMRKLARQAEVSGYAMWEEYKSPTALGSEIRVLVPGMRGILNLLAK